MATATSNRLAATVASPTAYLIWALTVVAALCGTYFGDPYVFGFTTLGLCWLTAAAGILGLAVCVFSNRLRARDRALILGALAIAAAALATALSVLAGFKWA